MALVHDVTIIEVGPRDGLQNEPTWVDTKTKIDFINSLMETGLKEIEVTSFVSAKAIPQLADSEEVFSRINKSPDVVLSALVPNEHGLEKAIKSSVKKIAVFTAASEAFNQRNINCSIKESIERFTPVIKKAKEHNIQIRAYISCVLGCPYEGEITPKQVLAVTEKLQELGVDEISFGDTIGVGTPKQTEALVKAILSQMNKDSVAMHFHDTWGQAIANIYTSIQNGINRFDSSVAGLGGCPYALGATGNVATEDVLYLMHGIGIKANVDIFKLALAGDKICKALGRKNQSKVANALLAKLTS